MTTALVTRRHAFWMQWMRNWARVVAVPAERDAMQASARKTLARSDVQAALKKAREVR